MQRILFHGTDHALEHPQYGVGKTYNDYGLGFYCTEHENMAKEWAVGGGRNGYANKYMLDCAGLNVLDLRSERFTAMHRLAILLKNRRFEIKAPLANEARDYIVSRFAINANEADVIEGYRADDSYFAFAQDFVSGAISYRQLKKAMDLGDLGKQVVLVSPKAFEQLRFLEALPAEKDVWLPLRTKRDTRARLDYLDRERYARKKGDLFITQIIDEEMGPSDARLQ